MEQTPVTPLESQWDSAIVRMLAYAGLALVGSILANIFGLSTEKFLAKGGDVVDKAIAFALIAVPLWRAYRARKNQPTPPIAGTPAVAATAEREASMQSSQGGYVALTFLKVLAAVAMVFAWTAPFLLQGCAGTQAAYREASDSLPNTAYVVAEHYSILVQQAADLREQPGTPPQVIKALQAADDAVRPFIIGDPVQGLPSLKDLSDSYGAIRDAKTEEDLQKAINDAVRELANFSKAVKAARGT